jgi:hypothetical protein
MSSVGIFQIDLPNNAGGRLNIDANGTMTVPNFICNGTITNTALTNQLSNISATATAGSNIAATANNTANSATMTANSALTKANACLPLAGGTVSGPLSCQGGLSLNGLTNNNFFMSSVGSFMIDAPNISGGRFSIDASGNVTVPNNFICNGTITNSQLTTQINNVSSIANTANTTANTASNLANSCLKNSGGTLTGNLVVPFLNAAQAVGGSYTGILVDNTNVNLGSACQITLRNGPKWAAVLNQSSQGDGNYFGISLTQNGNTNIAGVYNVKNYGGTITHNFAGAVNFNTTINTVGVQVNGAAFLELGAGVTKGGACGKIGYQGYSAGFLDIVGCGTGDVNRQIKLWDNVLVGNILDCPNYYQNGQPWQPLMNIPTDFTNNSVTSATLSSTGGVYCQFLMVNNSAGTNSYILQDFSYNNYNSLQFFSYRINGWSHLLQSDGSSFQKTSSSTWAIWSDRRLKRDIVSLDTAASLNQIMKLKPVSFYWKNYEQHTSKINRGFVADEYRNIFPDLVSEHECEGEDRLLCADTDGVSLTIQMDLIPTLVSSIQELKRQLDDVKKEFSMFKNLYNQDRADFLYINKCLSL